MAELPALIFDVNETLLDLETLTPHFARMFGEGAAMREWFAQLILYSEALTLAGHYAAFGELGGAVLTMLGATRGKDIASQEIETLKQAIATMPPHPEVPAALERLRQAGFRLFTLTNNPAATAARQLEAAGLSQFFERQFSVDDKVRRYKPAPEAYLSVAEALALPPARLCLIACHTWDTLGAAAAGWDAALIVRPGNAPLAIGPQPAVVGPDLNAVADALIARFGVTPPARS